MATPAQITPMDKELVHKHSGKEVPLTGGRVTGTDTFFLTTRWPEGHGFYSTVDGHDDPVLPAEAIRQAIPYLCHTAYGVPFGHRQIWTASSFRPPVLATRAASELESHISCFDVVRRANRLSGMSMHVFLFRDGVRLGTARAGSTNQSPPVYRRLRGRYADVRQAMARSLSVPPPVPPARVARRHDRDVLLFPAPDCFRLRIDTSHPLLFDHPVDHVPGFVPADMDVLFHRYVELDTPSWTEVSVLRKEADHVALRTVMRQGGKEAFRVDVTMRLSPRST
ncbi:ScbA/BarX family gamma-butyrolactone biosynthesis protein [Streptomyces sp. enrichment culture]|uniref:ScbA/BarX family gamma-butyrolactone biosynthesis protein n=1 Tax=Streptomyces sp. enrichment culture TaxID=1795815 RepID=UPI003F55DFC3